MSAEVEVLIKKIESLGKDNKDNKNTRNKYEAKDKYAIFMPHFCIDIFTKFEGNLNDLFASTHLETKNSVKEGGKATNSAFALAALGINTSIIAKTSKIGYILLKNFKSNKHLKNLDISHIKADGEIAITCAIETTNKNIMLSDAGSLKNFIAKNLTKEDYKFIKHAEIVAISDWGLNEKGSELAMEIFKFAKRNKVKTFFDPGDPAPKIKKAVKIDALNEEIYKILNYTDFLSVNEDEFLMYELNNFKGRTKIIYHTARFSSEICEGNEIAKADAFNVYVRRLTGAGDTFNSGYIFSEMKNFNEKEKLIFANATAAYYISNPTTTYANKKDIEKFLKKEKFKCKE